MNIITIFIISLVAVSPDAGVLFSKPAEIHAKKFRVVNKELNAEYTDEVLVTRDTLRMTCQRLIVEYDLNHELTRLLARGDVVAIDKDRWGRGDQADYDHRTGLMVIRGSPQARQGKRAVTGSQVTFAEGAERIEVLNAKTRVDDQADGGVSDPTSIDADKLVLDERQSIATWTGHVKARRGDTTMIGPEMTATYDEHGTVTHIEGHHGVEATQGTKWARGQRADYDATRGMLVVTGNPEARQDKNRMRGTKFIFYQGADLLEGENVTSIIEVDKKKKPKK